ncbi:MAG: perosamine synthetase [Chloroflexota bacterium]|nr:perosamine synthetase [Chloroflexota bacterium]
MIPRLKPYLAQEEFSALFHAHSTSVGAFEEQFAKTFGVKHALSFPYGRSALWAFFQAMGMQDVEIVQPAYTCSVVAHATVLSGNRPVFVDNNLSDYNMDENLLAEAITPQTRAVIPTHIFGYPMDVEKVNAIVREAEQRFGQRIYVIQDCAHSFDAQSGNRSVIQAGDGALFGLGISKQITSIFGGMFTTDDDEIAQRLRDWRNTHFQNPNWTRNLQRALYLLAVYPAFNETLYSLVYWLQEATPILNRLTKAYHLDEKIHFPPDFQMQLSTVEASVGLAQLKKYAHIQQTRRAIAQRYFNELALPEDWVMPPQVEGATYSHFAIRVPDNRAVMQYAAQKGVQLGELIEYSVPHLAAYGPYKGKREFPNSLYCNRHMINLPMHPGLKPEQIDKIIAVLNAYAEAG